MVSTIFELFPEVLIVVVTRSNRHAFRKHGKHGFFEEPAKSRGNRFALLTTFGFPFLFHVFGSCTVKHFLCEAVSNVNINVSKQNIITFKVGAEGVAGLAYFVAV